MAALLFRGNEGNPENGGMMTVAPIYLRLMSGPQSVWPGLWTCSTRKDPGVEELLHPLK
jgi:hypothetical protein